MQFDFELGEFVGKDFGADEVFSAFEPIQEVEVNQGNQSFRRNETV